MKHITFSDTTIKKKSYDIQLNQYDIISLLYEKGSNKDYELEIKKKIKCL